ncbi:hypothetical protein [Oceanobacillus sp. FSL W7-1309]|uniref:hypothetical protein n=1 Tax=Oceanobacillus sp. FSL W7-1309 TaxID=2954539 RepID=UPI0030F87194
MVESVFYAIYVDEDVYNKTVLFIETFDKHFKNIGEPVKNREELGKELGSRIENSLNQVMIDGYSLLKLCDEKRSDYLIKFGKKYIDK